MKCLDDCNAVDLKVVLNLLFQNVFERCDATKSGSDDEGVDVFVLL